MKYDFRSDIDPFIALLALEGGRHPSGSPSTTGEELCRLFKDALENWFDGDRRTTFQTLDTILSELSRQHISDSAAAGMVNHQYGMQLRADGKADQAVEFLSKAARIHTEWVGLRSGAQVPMNYFIDFVSSILEILLGQLAHEYIARGNLFQAFDCSEKGRRIATSHSEAVGQLFHTVSIARVRHGLEECEQAHKDFQEAYTIARQLEPKSQHDKERYAFSCWQLALLSRAMTVSTGVEAELFNRARGVAEAWIEPDMCSYFGDFQQDIRSRVAGL